jgi:NAD(P)-dependent dehydrogenase (short-subunit alcohol dehydrogenase family)
LASTNASSVAAGIDATGSVALITGADGNIGKHITINMARTHAVTVLLCHNATKCDTAVVDLQAELALEGQVGNFDTATIDLANFTSVRATAAMLLTKYSNIDVLINNADCYPCDYLSGDGYVAAFQANHFGHALLTDLLLPSLISAESTQVARVVNVASISGFGPFVEKDFRTSLKYSSLDEIVDWSKNVSSLSEAMFYAVTKFLIIQWNLELAVRYPGQLTSFAVSPGFAREPVTPAEFAECKGGGFLFEPCPMSYEQAATVMMAGALTPGVDAFSGSYLDFDTKIYPNAPSIFEWTQADPSCTPRPLPGWLGTDGTDVMWTDADRSQWYGIVQGITGTHQA